MQPEIGVKTRKVGGGRQLRDVARRLDFEVEQKQKVNFIHFVSLKPGKVQFFWFLLLHIANYMNYWLDFLETSFALLFICK